MKTFTLTVNGVRRTVTTDSLRPLLEVLREDLHLTGTKYGCGEGECRACTVLIDGKPVTSCITPVSEADQRSVTTIEGIARGGKLHPIQEAVLAEAGFQCGYCTPGMIMGVVGFLNANPRASADELVGGMRRHMCRCCNYPNLVKAIRRAAEDVRKTTAIR
jgi:aerobic-type carbon monoxide dehydrogenase small subunit (CoxS/CutS family)